MKKILEVCLSPDLGGLELHVKHIATNLHYKSVLVKNGKLENAYKKEGLEHFAISRYNFFALAKIIDENKIDTIHMHWVKDTPIIVLAKLLSKRHPHIVQTRHNRITRYKDDFYHRFLYKNIDTIIAVSQKVEMLLEKFIPKDIAPKFLTCYLGAKNPTIISSDMKTSLKSSLGISDEFVVCIVGRIEKAKGQHIVLEAVEKLNNNGINAKCLVVGHYMDKEYFDSLQSNKYALFSGFTPNPAYYMQISDCVVNATKEETFGLTLIEAMKCEVCVLGANIGGPVEIIEDGVSGLLFKSFNSDSLYEKLYDLAINKDLLNTLAVNGKKRADVMFDEEKQFGKLKSILERVGEKDEG